jgi:septum formation protein
VEAPFLKLAMPLVLGSRSPRRVELLASIGVQVMGRPCDVDESPLPGEEPRAYVQRIVRVKLRATLQGTPEGPLGLHAVLVADTTVTIEGHILGKPEDGSDAAAMLTRLAGRGHEVLTCYALAIAGRPKGDPAWPGDAEEMVVRTVATRVGMRALSATEIASYVASGEPFGKAGAYAIQGLGALLIERIDGSYSGVVGLPLCEVALDLARLGVVEPARGDIGRELADRERGE